MSEPEEVVPDPDESQSLSDSLMDAFIYAPLGLTLDSQELAPDLARRGRQHVAAARQIGEYAVKAGRKRLDDALLKADQSTTASDQAEAVAHECETKGQDQRMASSDLAIPGYDALAASQVVKRLDALSQAEIEAVRLYEAAGRGRRTILHKIARLQG